MIALALVLLGNSITAGTVSAPIGPPFAELLPFDVVNLGSGGASTRDWHPDGDLYSEVLPHLPAIAVVLLGTNDATGFFEPIPVEVPEYVARIVDLTAALLEDGATWVILLTAPRNFTSAGQAVEDRLHSYRETIRSLCSPGGDRVACGPDLHAELGRDDFAPDDVHPNGPAHAWIASELVRVLPEPVFAGIAAACALVVLYYWRKG